MERCPFCFNQLIKCDCPYEKFGLDPNKEPTCSKGLNEKQTKRWEKILNKKKRIPYVRISDFCILCGVEILEFFRVSDREWEKFVIPLLQKEVLCQDCYDRMKKLFPKGWKMAKPHL